jgi:hypothetical protein
MLGILVNAVNGQRWFSNESHGVNASRVTGHLANRQRSKKVRARALSINSLLHHAF